MRFIELHILQSFPGVLLNRGEFNEPKTILFGGATRARVSSQAWKRAARLYAQELKPELFGGIRSKRFLKKLRQAFVDAGAPEKSADEMAASVAKVIGNGLSDDEKAKTVLFFSEPGLDHIAKVVWKAKPGKDAKKLTAAISDAAGSAPISADIGLFGRMVASARPMDVHAAAFHSHWIGVAPHASDIDFFTAVDDLLPEEESGSGHMGHSTIGADTFYRCAVLSLDQIDLNLRHFDSNQKRQVAAAWMEASLLAVPAACQAGKFGATHPDYVVGMAGSGRPGSYGDAFTKTVSAGGKGIVDNAISALKNRIEETQRVFPRKVRVADIPRLTMAEFVDELLA